MISASEALASLDRAVSGVRRDEDRLTAMLSSSNAEADRLRVRQAEAYKALARMRLDELASAPAVAAIDGAEKRALAALERRRGGLDSAARRRKDAADRVDEARSTRADRAKDADRAVAAVETLTDDVEGAIARDAAWIAANDAAKTAEATADEADRKAAQAEADREEKRRPYEADRLFMYLWQRGYGTSAYSAGPFTRLMDGYVARVARYLEARPNYFMLNEIPLRLREHAGRCRTAVEAAAAARTAVERAALEAAGIKTLEAEAERCAALLARADAAVKEAEVNLAAIEAEADALLAGDGDPAIKAALDDLAAAIARNDLPTLRQRALKTPDPDDERIVEELAEIERGLVRVNAEIEETRRAALDLARRRSELERSRENFRGRGYDNPWGQIANEGMIAGILEGIVRGALSSRELDDFFNGNWSKRNPRSRDDFGGGPRLPRGPWGGSSGGGRSGGGFRTGGGSGGGGFRTGGGF